MADAIDAQIHELTRCDERSLEPRLGALLKDLRPLSAERRTTYEQALCRQILEASSPLVASRLAVAVGALVEDGSAAEPLAGAVLEALINWLPRAAGVTDGAQATAALQSLAYWFPAALTAWSRAPHFIPKARQALQSLLDALGDEPEDTRWLRLFCATSVGERFAFLFPELGQAYVCVVSGVSLSGQLSILISRALSAPLARIGASGPATQPAFEVASGIGPQAIQDVYSCSFRLYPWRSLNPETGMPIDGRFRWQALSGSGSHSQPEDFQPSAVEPLADHRIVAIVGPRLGSTFGGTRELGVERMFGPLAAEISEVQDLGSSAFGLWLERIRAALEH